MQQYNPWFFANNNQQQQQQNAWPFSAMGAGASNPFAQFAQNNPAPQQMQQIMQYWQQQMQQIQQLQSSPMMQSFASVASMPSFDSSQFFELQSSILQSQQTVNNATAELMQSLMQGATDTSQLGKSLADFAKSLVQANWQQATGLHNTEVQRNLYKQIKAGLQWTLEQYAAVPSNHNADSDKHKKTLNTWIDFADASSSMSESYNSFTEQVYRDFAEQAVEAIGKQEFDPRDSKKLLALVTSHYEKAFTQWLQSDSYSTTYGQFVNCSTALRKDQQGYIDSFVENFGLPSKQEMDTTHKRAQEQGKKIRNLQRQTNALAQQGNDTKTLETNLDKAQAENNKQLKKLQTEISKQLKKLQTETSKLSTLGKKQATEINDKAQTENSKQFKQLQTEISKISTLGKKQATEINDKAQTENSKQFKQLQAEISKLSTLGKEQADQINSLQSTVTDLNTSLQEAQALSKATEKNAAQAQQAIDASKKKQQATPTTKPKAQAATAPAATDAPKETPK